MVRLKRIELINIKTKPKNKHHICTVELDYDAKVFKIKSLCGKVNKLSRSYPKGDSYLGVDLTMDTPFCKVCKMIATDRKY